MQVVAQGASGVIRSVGRWFQRGGFMVLIAMLSAACAARGPRVVDHQFAFNGWTDGWAQHVDLLEYSYGDKYHMVARKVSPGTARLGYIANVDGAMPVGDFLLVRWRTKNTQEEREAKVDLRPLLPGDMSGHAITFVIDDPQLYVYLVTPRPKSVTAPPHLKTARSRFQVTYEIYPTNNYPAR